MLEDLELGLERPEFLERIDDDLLEDLELPSLLLQEFVSSNHNFFSKDI